MKFLIDENLSHRLVPKLEATFPGTVHVFQTDLPTPSEDISIWNYALNHDYVILTQDRDFDSLSQWKGFPPQVVLLHAWNLRTDAIAKRLISEKDKILERLSQSEVGVLEIYF